MSLTWGRTAHRIGGLSGFWAGDGPSHYERRCDAGIRLWTALAYPSLQLVPAVRAAPCPMRQPHALPAAQRCECLGARGGDRCGDSAGTCQSLSGNVVCRGRHVPRTQALAFAMMPGCRGFSHRFMLEHTDMTQVTPQPPIPRLISMVSSPPAYSKRSGSAALSQNLGARKTRSS